MQAVFCSQKCANSRGNNNRGGTIVSGYRYIYQPYHPFAEKKGYVAEHRLVMEKHIKRFLTKDEIIHHINGDPIDNRIDNLKLLPNQSAHYQEHIDTWLPQNH